jgi:hypothetical protein
MFTRWAAKLEASRMRRTRDLALPTTDGTELLNGPPSLRLSPQEWRRELLIEPVWGAFLLVGVPKT